MARRNRSPKRYKQVVTETVDLGDGGEQILIGKLSPITNRNQLGRAYCSNLVITYILNADGAVAGDQGGVVFYICSEDPFANVNVITARASPYGGGTVNLPVKAWVSGEETADAPGGELYIYAECTDTSLTINTSIRLTVEAWGSALLQYSVA